METCTHTLEENKYRNTNSERITNSHRNSSVLHTSTALVFTSTHTQYKLITQFK